MMSKLPGESGLAPRSESNALHGDFFKRQTQRHGIGRGFESSEENTAN